MVRISAVLIAVCMVLIGGSLAVVLFLRFGFAGAESLLGGLALLTALAVYDAVAARLRDRREATEQLSALSRSSGDLARQLAEFGHKLSAMDSKVEQALERALATAQPLAAELEELSTLVKQLADSVATHEAAFSGMSRQAGRAGPQAEPVGAKPASIRDTAASGATAEAPAAPAPPAAPVPADAAVEPQVAAFSGLDRDGIIALLRNAIETGKLDLYLQPIVTLPQRKVRYYEAISRLKRENGELVSAGDFFKYAEAGSLMPKLDQLTLLRGVQVVRRLRVKNRDIGLFCNVSGATLTDASFPQLLEFADANRAIAGSLIFEFTQSAVRAMGPTEHESLAALAGRGFRFSMDDLVDLRIEPRELTERGFRFIKAPAPLLLNRFGAGFSARHAAEFSDLLGHYGIDLIAERIESESTVVDLLDQDVRFGQGLLFAPPRPVRAEALQTADGEATDSIKSEAAEQCAAALASAAAAPGSPADIRGTLTQLVRTGSVRA